MKIIKILILALITLTSCSKEEIINTNLEIQNKNIYTIQYATNDSINELFYQITDVDLNDNKTLIDLNGIKTLTINNVDLSNYNLKENVRISTDVEIFIWYKEINNYKGHAILHSADGKTGKIIIYLPEISYYDYNNYKVKLELVFTFMNN